MKRLIVNADDFGYSPRFNEGILAAIRVGVVTSTTVLVDGGHISPRSLEGLRASVGLHLNLMGVEAGALKDTVNAQFQRFLDIFGKLPSHLDFHVPSRYMSTYDERMESILPLTIALAKRHELPMRSMHERERRRLRDAGIATPGHLIFPGAGRGRLLPALRGLPEGVTELIVHPGYYDPESQSSLNRQREEELEELLSPGFRQMLKAEGIALETYRSLAAHG